MPHQSQFYVKSNPTKTFGTTLSTIITMLCPEQAATQNQQYPSTNNCKLYKAVTRNLVRFLNCWIVRDGNIELFKLSVRPARIYSPHQDVAVFISARIRESIYIITTLVIHLHKSEVLTKSVHQVHSFLGNGSGSNRFGLKIQGSKKQG